MQKAESERRHDGARTPIADPIDAGIAAAIIAGCAYLWYVTTTFDEVPSFLGENVLPQHFPRLALAFIALCALIIPFEHRIFPERWRRIAADRSESVPHITWLTMLLLLLVVIAEPYVGTVITILTVCVALPTLWGERRWWLIGTFAIAFTALITLIFSELLQVHFEPGVFNISF